MGRKTTPPAERRTTYIAARCTERQRETAKAWAKREGKTVSDWLLDLAFTHGRPRKPGAGKTP